LNAHKKVHFLAYTSLRKTSYITTRDARDAEHVVIAAAAMLVAAIAVALVVAAARAQYSMTIDIAFCEVRVPYESLTAIHFTVVSTVPWFFLPEATFSLFCNGVFDFTVGAPRVSRALTNGADLNSGNTYTVELPIFSAVELLLGVCNISANEVLPFTNQTNSGTEFALCVEPQPGFGGSFPATIAAQCGTPLISGRPTTAAIVGNVTVTTGFITSLDEYIYNYTVLLQCDNGYTVVGSLGVNETATAHTPYAPLDAGVYPFSFDIQPARLPTISSRDCTIGVYVAQWTPVMLAGVERFLYLGVPPSTVMTLVCPVLVQPPTDLVLSTPRCNTVTLGYETPSALTIVGCRTNATDALANVTLAVLVTCASSRYYISGGQNYLSLTYLIAPPPASPVCLQFDFSVALTGLISQIGSGSACTFTPYDRDGVSFTGLNVTVLCNSELAAPPPAPTPPPTPLPSVAFPTPAPTPSPIPGQQGGGVTTPSTGVWIALGVLGLVLVAVAAAALAACLYKRDSKKKTAADTKRAADASPPPSPADDSASLLPTTTGKAHATRLDRISAGASPTAASVHHHHQQQQQQQHHHHRRSHGARRHQQQQGRITSPPDEITMRI
jgi:hypothetical protein